MGNLTQRKVGIISIEDPAQNFDAIVFGEIEPGKWMAGSDGFRRSQPQPEQKKLATETTPPNVPLQIAITYRGKELTIYRNAKKYVHYQMVGEPQTFGPDASLLLGVRATSVPQDSFMGMIADARIYAEALSGEQLAALKPNAVTKTQPQPWTWWTFEDGTCRDHTGRFVSGPPGKGLTIQNGMLVLRGKAFFKAERVGVKKP